ncbi:MAG TPA: hypothetical protein VMH26_13105 [Burkholderiales bacterium]|nr:hypothetical protein [Burkholderiales bacterium]
MLGWNKNKSDHPMADDKGAREFLAELPAGDSFKLLEEVSFWLDRTRSSEGLKPQRVFEIVDQLDTAGKVEQRKLAQEYLNGGNRRQRFHEQRIWNTQIELWRQLGAAYEFCLGQTLPGVSGGGALKAQAPILTCRAMRALTLELKWALMRYAPIDPTLWGRLNALYAQAEQGGFASKACTVYPGASGASTVQREYLKALMLSMSATDSLLPRKLEVAERIVAQFSEHFVLQTELTRGCHYHVDLAVARPPARLLAQGTTAATMRYFGPGAAAEVAAKAIAAINDSGAIPSDLNLGGNYEPSLVTEVLHHLARYWAPMPPARAQERRRSFTRINVVHDFDDIVAIISGESTDLAFCENIETWTADNESDGGYGAVIVQSKGDWLRVGTLLGVKLEDGAAWGVGIVRRLSSGGGQQRYVGIQTLAKGGALVKLFPVGAGNAPSGPGEDAVLLPSSVADSTGRGELNLLMRLGSFSPGRSFKMRAYERDYLLLPKQLLEGGQDFDMAKFRVMQRVV